MQFSRKLATVAAACAATAVMMSGCTGGSGGGGGFGGDKGHFDGVPDSLAKRLNSYAIHTDAKSHIDAHFFGIDGVSSLSDAMEKGLLSSFKSAGAFHGHRAFDPALTKPSERWDSQKFIEKRDQNPNASATTTSGAADDGSESSAATSESSGGSSGAAASGDTQRPVEASNSVIAAGGNFLVSRLSTKVGGKLEQRAFVTNLSDNKTQPAEDMFSNGADASKVGAMTVNDKALPVIDGNAVKDGDLSDLGKQVRSALGEDLQLPEAKESYLPDYSCGLLPCVGVTYDDGPADPKMTDELMGYLKDANVRATFFQIGKSVDLYPKQNKQIADMGNEVESHSWSHPQLGKMSASAIESQMTKTDEALKKSGTSAATELRPPYGSTSPTVDKTVDKRIIQWDVDTLDWKTRSTPKTVETGTKMSQPGSVILMHSIHEPTIKAAPELMKNLKNKGLYPVPAGYLFKGLPFQTHGEYYCRGYRTELCSNPEHPMVEKGKSKAKPAPMGD